MVRGDSPSLRESRKRLTIWLTRIVERTACQMGLAPTSNPLGGFKAFGGFDSHALPPANFAYQLLTTFLNSRREGLSSNTIEFYKGDLTLARSVVGLNIKGQDINRFLNSLKFYKALLILE